MTIGKIYAKSVFSAILLTSLLLTAPLSAPAEEERGKTGEPAGKTLVEKKCTICHSIDRVYRAKKTYSEWEQTVAKMMRYSDQMNFLNQKEKETVIDFLAQRKSSQAESEK